MNRKVEKDKSVEVRCIVKSENVQERANKGKKQQKE